jgi:hypothetical protein
LKYGVFVASFAEFLAKSKSTTKLHPYSFSCTYRKSHSSTLLGMTEQTTLEECWERSNYI